MRFIVPSDKFCVYQHKHNGIVFYIGSGSLARAVALRERGPYWKKYVQQFLVNEVEVEILAWFTSRSDAFAYERQAINIVKPFGNDETHQDQWWRTRPRKRSKALSTVLLDSEFLAKLKDVRHNRIPPNRK